MSKLFSALKSGLFSDEYKEFLLYTGAVSFYWILISYMMGWDWVAQAKSMVDCFKIMCFFSYIKSCEGCYKALSQD